MKELLRKILPGGARSETSPHDLDGPLFELDPLRWHEYYQPDREAARLKLAQDPATPVKVLRHLLACADGHARVAAAKNPSSPQDVIQLLQKAGASSDLGNLNDFYTPLSEKELSKVIALGAFGAMLVARRPEITERLFREILQGGYYGTVTAELLKNPHVPGHLLDELFRHHKHMTSTLEMSFLHDNPNTPSETLADYMLCSWTMGRLLENPNTPPGLKALYEKVRDRRSLTPEEFDQVLGMRSALWWMALLGYRNLSETTLRHIFNHRHLYRFDLDLFIGLRNHPNTPGDILAFVATESPEGWWRTCYNHPNFPKGDFTEIRKKIQRSLPEAISVKAILDLGLHNMGFTGEEMDFLMTLGKAACLLVAGSPDAPAHHIDALLFHRDWQVRAAASKHPRASPQRVELCMALNLTVHGYMLDEVVTLEDRLEFSLDPEQHPIEECMRVADWGSWGKVVACCHPEVSPDALRLWAEDPDYQVRCAVARNLNTPTDVLETLLKDHDYQVATAACYGWHTRERIKAGQHKRFKQNAFVMA